jgi:hypothetical protein
VATSDRCCPRSHRSRLDDQTVVQPILEMAAKVGADGFCREQTAMIARSDSRPLPGFCCYLSNLAVDEACQGQSIEMPHADNCYLYRRTK